MWLWLSYIAGVGTGALIAAGLLAWDPSARFIWNRLGRDMRAEKLKESGK